ncbi:restriction endonuclease subunit S [Photobacterium leiognathi subsp. mandapamensis]|uniref:restriction endonuclease subunit S n=1 Tax=Photobacterium leiognathi TaxID=553611 RepID=UPI003AF40773
MSLNETTVEAISLEMGDAPFGSNLKNTDYTDSGALVVQGKNIQGRAFDWSDKRHVSFDKYASIPRSHCFEGDLLFPKVGTIGKVGILSFCEGYDKYLLSTNTMRLKVDPEKADPYFIYCYFTWSKTVNLIKAMNSKSVQPVFNFTSLKKFPLVLPSLEKQRLASKVLKNLDDKIILNNQTNQTLEEMAQAIFKSWFVDFDPVKAKMNGGQPEGMDASTASLFPEKLVESELGLIPEGWEVGDLSDLMDFNPKRTLKKGTIAPYLDMKNMPTSGHLALDIYDREMGSGTKFKNGDSLLARITPCLENGKTAYVDFLEDEQVGWGSTEYIVMRSKSDSYKYFSYYMARFEPFRKFAIQSMTGTSGRQRAQAQTVQTMPFAIPPISVLEKFDAFIAPNMQMIKSHGSENRTLANLRDTLLPKLLSGEIELETSEEL